MLNNLQPGQYVYTWHDAGIGGMQPSYFRIQHASLNFVWIVWEHEPDHSIKKKRDWIEDNFYPVDVGAYRPEIPLGGQPCQK